jgi:hypothetical protein
MEVGSFLDEGFAKFGVFLCFEVFAFLSDFSYASLYSSDLL